VCTWLKRITKSAGQRSEFDLFKGYLRVIRFLRMRRLFLDIRFLWISELNGIIFNNEFISFNALLLLEKLSNKALLLERGSFKIDVCHGLDEGGRGKIEVVDVGDLLLLEFGSFQLFVGAEQLRLLGHFLADAHPNLMQDFTLNQVRLEQELPQPRPHVELPKVRNWRLDLRERREAQPFGWTWKLW